MINTSGQDASLLQWNVIGPGGGGTTTGGVDEPEPPPQANRPKDVSRISTALVN